MRSKKKINKKLNKRLYRVLLFLVKFNIFAIPLYLILLTGFQSQFLINLTKDLAFGLVKSTGMDAERNDYIILPVENGQFAASIDWDCTGWKSILALFALIFATDFRLRKKLLGLMLIPVVYVVNIIRIWFMFFYVNNFGFANYPFVHATIWSWGLISTILVLWVLWMIRFPNFDMKPRKKSEFKRIKKR